MTQKQVLHLGFVGGFTHHSRHCMGAAGVVPLVRAYTRERIFLAVMQQAGFQGILNRNSVV